MVSWKSFVILICISCTNLFAESVTASDKESNRALAQKTIGMIGGVSWESTALYYKLINQTTREHLGGIHSAKLLIYSFNYDPIVKLERQEKWNNVGDELAHAAKTLQESGADFIILCCNTLHKIAPSIEDAVHIPFLHIADPAGAILRRNQIHKVGLLGTRFTMEDGFYSHRLENKFGLEVIVPYEEDRMRIDAIIYDELCQGKVSLDSKQELIQMINRLCKQGAEAVLLGCTELGMLVSSEDFDVPIYDTTLLHATETVKLSLNL